jgi:hypothetical protein
MLNAIYSDWYPIRVRKLGIHPRRREGVGISTSPWSSESHNVVPHSLDVGTLLSLAEHRVECLYHREDHV